MTARRTTDVQVVAVRAGRTVDRPDQVVTEEPLEIRAAGPRQQAASVGVTMRTPGDDFELAAGFLFTEGLIGPGAVAGIRYCAPAGQPQEFNVVTVDLRTPFAGAPERTSGMTSACGTCGKASLDQVEVHVQPIPLDTGPLVEPAVIAALPDRLRQGQPLFGRTGGLHAAGLFDADGQLHVVREDVGRHNAVDKVVGHCLLHGRLPAHDRILMVSGRVGFEIVQKAAAAGIPILCAVSAPSSLAVDAARRFGVTVAGFVRGETCNIYTHPHRVIGTTAATTATA